ncbi:unnamed protein product [Cyprideis torosa]|uniref:Ras-related protein Rab n=1 Tax=Cyprideis torosa TaxID=163714 RepID=A0A7R8WG61_9CRUS|nr:unnamed protein product [Cyprideis torosa]CAG0897810.1 unnamed protein product [Cyprideis torosa]
MGVARREHLYKILVIGELGTGKTSIIKRYVHQFFSQHYRATIGVDFALKVLNWDANTVIRLQLWDIAGQERFGNMTRVYYKEAVGCFIVFDASRTSTFEAVLKWKQDLDNKVVLPDGSSIPCVLLANKPNSASVPVLKQSASVPVLKQSDSGGRVFGDRDPDPPQLVGSEASAKDVVKDSNYARTERQQSDEIRTGLYPAVQ